jgi:cell division septation protein DedD
MMASTKTRTQRRMEKKQALILLVLVLAVSLASFTLGVVVGRRGAVRDLAQKQQVAERILVTQDAVKAVEKPAPLTESKAAEQDSAAETTESGQEETKLTFYDNLAKEETVPLGSGINLPPAQDVPKKPKSTPPIELPDKPIVKKQDPAVKIAEVTPPVSQVAEDTMMLPKSDPQGSYAVQVGSFAAAGDAGKFKQNLIDKGYPAFVVEADLGAKGLWYRVRLGPYADAAAAKTVQQLAEKKEQIKGFISRQ